MIVAPFFDMAKGLTHLLTVLSVYIKKGEIMDILKQVSELKDFLGDVYSFLEEYEDKFEDSDEFEEIKTKTWDWQQELAKFLPDL